MINYECHWFSYGQRALLEYTKMRKYPSKLASHIITFEIQFKSYTIYKVIRALFCSPTFLSQIHYQSYCLPLPNSLTSRLLSRVPSICSPLRGNLRTLSAGRWLTYSWLPSWGIISAHKFSNLTPKYLLQLYDIPLKQSPSPNQIRHQNQIQPTFVSDSSVDLGIREIGFRKHMVSELLWIRWQPRKQNLGWLEGSTFLAVGVSDEFY
jgi:hypothetical protein